MTLATSVKPYKENTAYVSDGFILENTFSRNYPEASALFDDNLYEEGQLVSIGSDERVVLAYVGVYIKNMCMSSPVTNIMKS